MFSIRKYTHLLGHLKSTLGRSKSTFVETWTERSCEQVGSLGLIVDHLINILQHRMMLFKMEQVVLIPISIAPLISTESGILKIIIRLQKIFEISSIIFHLYYLNINGSISVYSDGSWILWRCYTSIANI
jgi:hypothetical protein